MKRHIDVTTPFDFAVAALDEANRRVVGVMVEPRKDRIHPYLWSGFVVELDGGWFWVTAAHCAQQISEALEHYPAATISIVFFGTSGGRKFFTPRASWQFVDLHRSLAVVAQTEPDGPTPRECELFDLAFWRLPELVQCYLIGHVRPFTSGEIFYDQERMRVRLESVEHAMFVAGIPEVTHEVSETDKTFGVRLRVFPVHPYPDSESDDVRREVEFEGRFFTWIPTSWNREAWSNHIRGVSGGPLFIVSDDGQVTLGGVVAFQKPARTCPDYIGVCDVMIVLGIIREHLTAPDGGSAPALPDEFLLPIVEARD